jgi:prepilin-type processing-associated H-X9-DG protein
MFIAETSWENGPWTAGGFPTVRGLAFNGMPYFGKNGQFCAVHRRSVLSNGPMLTNIVFADGSVRAFSETIEPKVFEAMATIAGGEAIDLPEVAVPR